MHYLIIGQGLAGSVLAITLIKKGHKVTVYEDRQELTSSKVAVGLFNPVTGMSRSKTWYAEQLFPYLKTFYSDFEAISKSNFFHELPIYMPFSSIENQNEWMAKTGEDYWRNWVEISQNDQLFENKVYNEYGAMQTKHSGWLNTKQFIASTESFLLEKNALIFQKFNENNLIISVNFIKYEEIKYDGIIYCNGLEAANSKYFSWLNHAHVKGDVFEIECKTLPTNFAINKNGFILPIQNNIYKAGSTYNNFFNNPVSITEEGYEELNQKLKKILKIPYRVTKHIAATRPATKDRRPLLGSHPKYNNVFIFNGLGTKGVSLAPYLANHLVDFIEQKVELLPEININRCLKYYTKEFQNI